MYGSFCKRFIGRFILVFFFRNIGINLNKTVLKPDGGQIAKLQKYIICNTALFQHKKKAMRKRLMDQYLVK